jgi:hypothetical protein
MAGVGKTALAVHAAHRLAPRFPDGQIFLPPADNHAATGRLLDYYLRTADTAGGMLARQSRTRSSLAAPTPSPPPVGPDLPDRTLAWLRAERGNLLTCLDEVTLAGQHARVIALTTGLAALLRQDGPWTDAVTRHAAAVQAGRQSGDRTGEAGALLDLGDARHLICDYPPPGRRGPGPGGGLLPAGSRPRPRDRQPLL